MKYPILNSGIKPASVLIVSLGMLCIGLQSAFSAAAVTAKASAPAKATAAPATSGSSSKSPILRMRSKGESVKELQNDLKNKGFYKGSADGFFGNQTQSAVIQFQKSKKIVADGVVGAGTWAALR